MLSKPRGFGRPYRARTLPALSSVEDQQSIVGNNADIGLQQKQKLAEAIRSLDRGYAYVSTTSSKSKDFIAVNTIELGSCRAPPWQLTDGNKICCADDAIKHYA